MPENTSRKEEYGSPGYAFNEFVVNPADRVLTRNGEEVTLTAKVFDLLLAFVRNPSRLMTKDELIDLVWPESFVEEGNLARNVSTLRKVLGDTDKDHRLILTVQGKGYRFVADVRAIDPEQPGISTPEPQQKPVDIQGNFLWRTTGFVRRHWILFLILLITGALFVAASRMGNGITRHDSEFVSQIGQKRLTQSGNVSANAISRDGKYVALALVESRGRALYLRRVDSDNLHELVSGDPMASFWAVDISPDDSYVYFISKLTKDPGGHIYRVPLLGGSPELLSKHADGALTVSHSGKQIAYTRIDRDRGITSVLVADSDGSNARTLKTVRLESSFQSLDWAPDDRSLLVVQMDYRKEGNLWKILEMPLHGDQEKQIGRPSKSRVIAARWVRNREGIILDRIEEANRLPQLYFLSYPDLREQQITFDPEGKFGVELANDGRTLLTIQQKSERTIWVEDGRDPERFLPVTHATGVHYDTVSWLSEDRLVFDEDENGSFDLYKIWTAKADGTDRKQLTDDGGFNYEPAASYDGRLIAYISKRSGNRQVWLMNSDGTGKHKLTAMDGEAFGPQFTKDGKWIFFEVNTAGKTSVWRIPVTGGKPKRVLDPGVFSWAVSPSGDSICYAGFGPGLAGSRTVIHSLKNRGPDREVNFTPANWISWTPDEGRIIFNTRSDQAGNIWEYPAGGGVAAKLTNFEDERVFGCAESPKKMRLACIRYTLANDLLLIRTGK